MFPLRLPALQMSRREREGDRETYQWARTQTWPVECAFCIFVKSVLRKENSEFRNVETNTDLILDCGKRLATNSESMK